MIGKIMETIKTENEIELLKELAEKYNYFVIPNKYSTYDDKTKSKIVKKHTIEEISKLLDNDDLYIEWNFKNGTSFDYRKALIYLLLQEVIFINDYERTLENGEIIKHSSLLLNSSDIFAWGYSDAEEITTENIKEIYEYVVKDQEFGYKVWTIKKYNKMPQKPLYDKIQQRGIWNLDEMNLEKNDW